MKQKPGKIRFCGVEQSPVDGEAETMTGALCPRSMLQVAVSVNGPKILSSPAETVRDNVNVTNPPQHASGNAEPVRPEPEVEKTACTRLALTGVTFVAVIT